MKFVPFIAIIIGVLLNSIAQLALKAGVNRIGHFAFTLENVIPIGLKVAVNPYILLGLSCYVFSVVAWILALSRTEVSVAYPMLSMGYVVTAIAGYYLFQEDLSLVRICGIIIIIIGVFLISRT